MSGSVIPSVKSPRYCLRRLGKIPDPNDAARLTIALLFGAAAASSLANAQPQRITGLTPSPPGAVVYFVDLQDGATVPAKLKLNFGLRDMGIAPAGSDRPNSGHHHLLVDTELPPLNKPGLASSKVEMVEVIRDRD